MTASCALTIGCYLMSRHYQEREKVAWAATWAWVFTVSGAITGLHVVAFLARLVGLTAQ